MQSKVLILLLLSIIYLPIAQAEEISVVSADTTWILNLSDATEVGRLVGDPGVMVVKYADAITYNPLGNPSDVSPDPDGDPGVMVVKYADAITYNTLENPSEVGRLAGEPGVMVVKYADSFTYYPLENINPQPTPQISSITPNQTAAGTFELTINGNNFDSGAVDRIYWKVDGHFVGNGTIKTRSTTQIVVTESLANATPGVYVIKVKNSDGQESKGADLTITAQPSQSVISFSPQNFELQQGSSQKIQIVINKVPAGLSGTNITVSVLDPAIANITAVSPPGWNGIPDNSTSAVPASSVWIKAIDLNNQVHTGDTNVSLGNITINGKSAGTTNLSILPTEIEDDIGEPINPAVATGMIHVVLIPVLPGCTKTPTDLNNDGLYEDINGNGRLDFADVVTYYNNMAWITQSGLIIYFDYNHNGRIDFNDVVKLYNMH